MSGPARIGVCSACKQRLHVLDRFGAEIDRQADDAHGLQRLLELNDEALIDQFTGGAESQRHREHAARPHPGIFAGAGGGGDFVCSHHCAFPARLIGCPLAPNVLRIDGGAERLRDLLAGRVVTILGGEQASKYGLQTAYELACGLAARGVVVVSALGGKIDLAVQRGALHERKAGVAILAPNPARIPPSSPHDLFALRRRGCTIAAVAAAPPRRWWRLQRLSTALLLADLTIVVEAGADDEVLASAALCRARRLPLAAVPGPVSSLSSRGTNALIAAGAHLVCESRCALDLLRGGSVEQTTHSPRQQRAAPPEREVSLEPGLARVLERVRGGDDTLDALRSSTSEAGELELALAELELLGALRRGVGGRYLPSTV